MKQDEKRELCAACFIYAYQTAEMRESPVCAECPTVLTTRNREDCEAYYDPDVAPLGWFDIGEPEGYICSRCLAYLNCDQTHVGGRSRDYDFSAMSRYWRSLGGASCWTLDKKSGEETGWGNPQPPLLT